MKSRILVAALAAVSVVHLFAAPAKQDPVAEGFPSWNGVLEKNYVKGRMITSSDLRQRVVVMIALRDDENLRKNLLDIGHMVRGVDDISGHGGGWDVMPMLPRKCIVLLTFLGKSQSIVENLKAAFKPPKEMDDKTKAALQAWSYVSPAYYRNVTLDGFQEITEFPYVCVLDGKTTKPLYSAAYKPANNAAIRAAISKGKASLGGWRELTGVEEVVHHKDIEKKILSGKPLKPCLVSLKANLSDKNPEKAKEAQIMYDAINQFASDLKLRIAMEYRSAPARAFADAQKLFRYFPQEKKNLATIDAHLKNNKSAVTLGKIYEKYLEWSQPDFMFKNASDAKKAVQLVNSWRKPLEKMANDPQNTDLQGEASLVLAQIDSIGDLLMTKVPQK